MSAAQERAERIWQRARSTQVAVLEGLEAARRAHPAGSARLKTRPEQIGNVTVVLEVPDDAA